MTESGLLTASRACKERIAIRTILLSIAPFIMCVAGYYATALWWERHTYQMPSLVGLQAYRAMSFLSRYHLYPYVIRLQEHNHVPAGTVIEHWPRAAVSVRPHSTVYMTLSQEPDSAPAPCYVGLSYQWVAQCARNQGITLRVVPVASGYQYGTVVAQNPSPGGCLDQSNMLIYVADTAVTQYLMPNCVGYDAADVIRLCQRSGIPVRLYDTSGAAYNETIEDGQYTVIRHEPPSYDVISAKEPPDMKITIHPTASMYR